MASELSSTPPIETVLADLIAAGLVTHELIGDPEKLGGETACLRALCAQVAGSVYRVAAYHYAFRLGEADMGGFLADLTPGRWAETLELALSESLGVDAVWVNATDLLPETDAMMAQPILLLQAHDAAVTDALTGLDLEAHAIINARYAAACARQSSDPAAGSELARRLEAIEARLAEADAAQAEIRTGVETLLARLEDQAKCASEDNLAFQARLSLSLAEFLARIEAATGADTQVVQIPQFSS